MNPLSENRAIAILKAIEESRAISESKIIISPPFIYLEKLKNLSPTMEFAAQNCSSLREGALTGEISPFMLADLKIGFVILGHSERRAMGETDELISEKVNQAIQAGLKVILCVGEKEEMPEEKAKEIILSQLIKGLAKIPQENLDKIMVAYEPVWAIGTGKNASAAYVSKIAGIIKENINNNLPVFYGGSVKGDNISEYLNAGNLDGALVGGASLKEEEIKKIIKAVQ